MALKGNIPWNKGKTNIYSKETLENIKLGRSKQDMGMWITDGKINKKHYDKNNIPDGWRQGRANLKVNQNGSNIISEYKYIKNFGEALGKEKWERLCKSKKTDLLHMQTKYGEEEGRRRWELSCLRKKYAGTVGYYIQKYGSEAGKLRWKEYCKSKASWDGNRVVVRASSKVATDLFAYIESIIPPNSYINLFYQKDLYGKVIQEYFVTDANGKRYFYDFVCILENSIVCIEYNGTHVHPKSSTDLEWKHAFSKSSAEICFNYDEVKKKEFIEHFDKPVNYYVIWSDDKTKLERIQEIINENFSNHKS